jgi:hypothetical protein
MSAGVSGTPAACALQEVGGECREA